MRLNTETGNYVATAWNTQTLTKVTMLIGKHDLTDLEVWQVVLKWYTNGMYPEILQDETGRDLEEICEDNIQFFEDAI